jgi:hypothetical protein
MSIKVVLHVVVLEMIHTDICSLFNVTMVDRFNSFITFTDDYSRYGYMVIFTPYTNDLKHLRNLKYLRLR